VNVIVVVHSELADSAMELFELTHHRAERAVASFVFDADQAMHPSEAGEQARLGDPQADQHQQGDRGGRRDRHVEPSTAGHTDGRAHPQRRRGGQSAYGAATAQHRSGADEADARRHLGGDPGRVGASLTIDTGKPISPRDREQGRAHSYQGMGPHAGIVATDLPLQAEHRAEDCGDQDLEHQLHIHGHQPRCTPQHWRSSRVAERHEYGAAYLGDTAEPGDLPKGTTTSVGLFGFVLTGLGE
jgi:hypothetical protein